MSTDWKTVLRGAVILQQELLQSLPAEPNACWLIEYGSGERRQIAAEHRTALAHVVEEPPVVWDDPTWRAATVGFESFIGTPAPAIEPQWWHIDLAVPFDQHTANSVLSWGERESGGGPSVDADGSEWIFCATVFSRATVGRGVGADVNFGLQVFERPDRRSRAPSFALRAVPLNVVGDPIDDPRIARIYARLKFLTLPFVAVEERDTADRAERRRNRGRSIRSAVRVITLRRSGGQGAPRDCQPTDGGGEKHWGGRWMVRGHWRRQWYPARRVHEAIWVDAYVKGPEDAPLMAPRHTVMQAVR